MATFKAHSYQQRCIEQILNLKGVGLFLDMGLGKTVITLTAIKELFDELCIAKVLVIAPLAVCNTTWINEAKKWEHLEGLKLLQIKGTEKKRIELLNTPADIYVINCEQVAWLVKHLGRKFDFDMVVVDELSKFKSSKSIRFRALKAVRPFISRFVGLTGTPSPNGTIDLWSQLYLIDQGERLGRFITRFKDYYFSYNPYSRQYVPNHKAKYIPDKIKDVCISLRSEDLLDLPDLIFKDYVIPTAGTKFKKMYDKLERDFILESADSDGTITATNAAVLVNKLLQLCSGAVYDDNKEAIQLHDLKIKGLKEVVDNLNGQPTLIMYNYQHEVPRILKALQGHKCEVFDSKRSIELQRAWNNKEIECLIMHPASTAYGLNLQDGGHHLIWYSLPWSLELYLQTNKRLHRQGQKNHVTVIRLCMQGCQDERIIKVLHGKDVSQRKIIDGLNALASLQIRR